MTGLAPLSFPLSLAGFACLAAATPKHQRTIFLRAPGQAVSHAYQACGALLLAMSLACAMAGWAVAPGIVAWIGMATVSAFTVVLLLTYRPRALAPATFASFALPLMAIAVTLP